MTWNTDPCRQDAWCPKCKGPMFEGECASGNRCRPDDGRYHALEIAMAIGRAAEDLGADPADVPRMLSSAIEADVAAESRATESESEGKDG